MRSSSIAITIGHSKEAALYFDHVIPVFIAAEMLDKSGQLTPWPPAAGHNLLPSEFSHDNSFLERLIAVNEQTVQIMFKTWINQFNLPHRIGGIDVNEQTFNAIEEVAAEKYFNFLTDYKLTHVPVLSGDVSVDQTDDADIDEANTDVAVALGALRLIDVSKTSWEQIAEFRRDSDARARLRRLRLFAAENYAGKTKTFIEDDLQTKIDDYEEQVKRWGFETKNCVLSMLLTSKSLAGGASGSLISLLFGAPTVAVTSAVGGVVIEIGRIFVEVSRRRFALRNALRDNPVSYLAQVKSKVADDAERIKN